MHELLSLQALALSKQLLLETASPDSLARLKDLNNPQIIDECVKIYFEDQNHMSLCDLLQAKLFDPQSPVEGFLLHITTHGHLLSRADVNFLCHSLHLKSDQVNCFLLQEFDTEMDFSLKLKYINSGYIQYYYGQMYTVNIVLCMKNDVYSCFIGCHDYNFLVVL